MRLTVVNHPQRSCFLASSEELYESSDNLNFQQVNNKNGFNSTCNNAFRIYRHLSSVIIIQVLQLMWILITHTAMLYEITAKLLPSSKITTVLKNLLDKMIPKKNKKLKWITTIQKMQLVSGSNRCQLGKQLQMRRVSYYLQLLAVHLPVINSLHLVIVVTHQRRDKL